ncbi:YqaJ viral recombinase family protein, partial [Bartonella bacilliformis]
ASPDGLIGKDGLIEIKCLHSTTHLRFSLNGDIKPEYLLQMQFQMACTERKWCDFISYDPQFTDQSVSLRIKVQRMNRNDEQIEHINKAVEHFLTEIKQDMKQIFIKAA